MTRGGILALLGAVGLVGCAHDPAVDHAAPRSAQAADVAAPPSASEPQNAAAAQRSDRDDAVSKPAPPPDGDATEEATAAAPLAEDPVPIDGQAALFGRLPGAGMTASVALGPFDVACFQSAEIFSDPAAANERLQQVADAQGIALGALTLVRVETAVSEVAGMPQARLCRPVPKTAELYAPLFREVQPASRWVILQPSSEEGSILDQLVSRLNALSMKRPIPGGLRPFVLMRDGKTSLFLIPLAEEG